MQIPKDSGKRVVFKSGAIREETTGKGRYDMMFTRAIRRVALRYELGGIKYGDSDNFLKGMNLRRFADSSGRHQSQGLQGLDDEDHWAAAAWNLLALMEIQERIKEGLLPKELDDLPHHALKTRTRPSDEQRQIRQMRRRIEDLLVCLSRKDEVIEQLSSTSREQC